MSATEPRPVPAEAAVQDAVADDGAGPDAAAPVRRRRMGLPRLARFLGLRMRRARRRRRVVVTADGTIVRRRAGEALAGAFSPADESALTLTSRLASRAFWTPERLRTWFLRLNAVFWMAMGLFMWARITGFLPWRAHFFWDMPIEWRSAIVFYGVLDLVVAVGLWLATPWGVVIWLFTILAQIVTHGAFAEIFGERPFRIPFYAVTVLVYAWLTFRMRKSKT
ncbi:DUF6163 family protein [Pseudoxanthobacter sp.]|uniref:DUF6163 family protein n=1 Tax=Pseudoxanthobacter sp. TaxID=1925742 RepID=UPI002FE3F251